ncbi:ABC transporter ATP-binding protein/permease [Candidatus Saccharibacteria bacterium]|nr:ABC transporter ATP-binding protein/permease [Candidatus Saccharibacteria bacterium]
MLELRGVTKVYETGGLKHAALDHLSINFRANEFVAILGPSGSGKTTLLNIIGGLDHYTSGNIRINEVSTLKFRDKDWDAYRNHRIGFVFQNYNLIPHQTVLNNVRLALTLSGISKREAVKRAKNALIAVGLAEHVNKKPNQLSGGQMQRVAIARALVNDPEILLADEPTGALDTDTSVQIMDILKEVARDRLVIMVTHNPELAEKYATRIVTLRDGKITSDSDPYDGKIRTTLKKADANNKGRHTKMSFFTALSLSLKNLLTKKGRTVMVAFAGSIGIIGIALILAVSTGFQNYIDTIEHDTLTSYPLAIMRDSTNVTGILLSLTGGNNNDSDGKLVENQVLTSSLGSVTHNDLDSFMKYYENHKDELEDDVRLVEYEYNVDPMIYTVDATGELAKLNPSSLFTTILGSNSLLNSYSSMTSVFRQYDSTNLQNDTKLLAGRYPEKYNEMVIYLSNPGEVSELLTYSLGFHDTDELSEIITKIMGGEKVNIKRDPLELTYDDLLNVDLRLLIPADTYQYNEKYEVYEDMSSNADFMWNVYNNKSEKLKIVGVVTMEDSLMAVGSGILYLPSLTTHIIDESSKTEIVQKQIANPTIDIFSNTKFGDKQNKFNFEFSDFVSVDESKIANAVQVNIDQNAVAAKTEEYMKEIAGEVTADVEPVQTALMEELESLARATIADIVGDAAMGTFMYGDIDAIVAHVIEADSHKLAEMGDNYLLGKEQFESIYGSILGGMLNGYAAQYAENIKQYNPEYDLATDPVMMPSAIADTIVDGLMGSAEVEATFNNLAIRITEFKVQMGVVDKVMGLTSYLTSSFTDAFGLDTDALIGAFTLNFSEDELARVVSAMFNEKDATYNTNLALLGYQDLNDPMELAFYFNSFDGKTHFMDFLDHYNDLMREYNQDSKVIEYSDTTGVLMSSVKTIVDAVSYVLIAFVSISLIVSSIMIGIITYISVYERTKEIGILRAIGASKRNISSIFNAETFIVGLLSGLFGIGVTYILIPIINMILHHFTGDIPLNAALAPISALLLIILSVILTLIGGLIPARAAAKKDPVEALRSE